MTSEDLDVTVARIDTRVGAVERDVRDIKSMLNAQRLPWPTIVSSVAAAGALVITLVKL